MIICILTDVALWPPEYSKCGFFSHMEEGLYQKMLPESLWFFEKKNALFFWWKRLPQQKKYKHALCEPPTLLSINLSICLSIFYFISVSLDLSNFLSIDLLWFIFLHTVYQRFLLVLGFFPQLPYYRRVLISIFQKTSPTLRFPLIPHH